MVQNRSIAVCIILSIVTCGIYGLYWFVCLTDDANTVSGDVNGTSGIMALVTHYYYVWHLRLVLGIQTW